MHRTIQLVAAALVAAVVVPLAFVLMASDGPAASAFGTILMGNTDVKGGSTKIGEIDPAVIPTAGPHASGTFTNAIAGGVILHDLDISIKNGSAGSISVGGGAPVPFSGAGTAHVAITMSGGTSQAYEIKDLTAEGDKNLILNVTPSDHKTIGNVSIESNILPVYRLDRMSDLARNGAEMHHSAALALVHNADSSERMTSITGSISFPGTSAADLTGVYLFEADNDPIGNAQIQISGLNFTITDFGSVAGGTYIQVLFVFDAEMGGQPARAEIRGTFAP